MSLNELSDLLILLKSHGVTRYKSDKCELDILPSKDLQKDPPEEYLKNGNFLSI